MKGVGGMDVVVRAVIGGSVRRLGGGIDWRRHI
jgi:hypothetical protein